MNRFLKTKIISVFLVMTFLFTGCGLIPSVELTEQEQKVIAEYAAGLLLKYDRNYSGSIMEIETGDDNSGVGIIEENLGENPEQEAMQTPADEQLPDINPEGMPSENTTEDIVYDENGEIISEPPVTDAGDIVYSDMSIAQAIGLDGFDVIFKLCEVSDIYPAQESEDMVFSMQAAPGKELLICHFSVTNDGADAKLCDVLNSNAVFRLMVNGSEKYNAQRTILLDDFVNYCDNIEGYGVVDTVIIFEVPVGTADTISQIDLIIKNGEQSTTHALR